jgi:hypothetical protein
MNDLPTQPSIFSENPLKHVFAAAGGPPKVLRMDNRPELVS